MIGFHQDSIKLIFYLLVCIGSIYSIAVASVTAYDVDFYSKDEPPFDVDHKDWIARFWNWSYNIQTDPQTQKFAGLKENGCLVHKDSSMVMLVDSAAGGTWNQKCTISQNEGILIPIWTGECNQGAQGYEKASFQKLSECARGFDTGIITGEVKVDNTPVAKLDVVDYKTNQIENVTEVYTNQFNATMANEGHITTQKIGTFPAAAHGWFVFLKPLQPGSHTIYYQNDVGSTTLNGGFKSKADITYSFEVK